MWKFKFIKTAFISAILLQGSIALANSRLPVELQNPDELHAAITIERGLSGVSVSKNGFRCLTPNSRGNGAEFLQLAKD